MADIKTRGIVLKTSDYKDNDKLIRLYTLEHGKITALARGVKKANAKLKIPAQVFCFGEYLMTGNIGGGGAFPVMTGCTVEESFFSLASDPDKFSAAASVMELVDKALPQGERNPAVFVRALKTMREFLRAHAYYDGEGDSRKACKTILLNFTLEFLGLSGYNPRLEKCCVCGESRLRERSFDFSACGAACKRCAGYNSAGMSALCHGVLSAAQRCGAERLDTLNLDAKGLDEALALCKQIAEYVFEIKILSTYF